MLFRKVMLVAAAALTGSGCYTYRVQSVSELEAGRDVRMRVTAERAGQISDDLGSETTRVLDGTFVDWAANDVGLFEVQIPGVQRRMVQRVSVPRSDLVDVEVREFDRWKSVAVAVPAFGLAVALIADQFAQDENRKGETGGETDNQRIPLFRIVF